VQLDHIVETKVGQGVMATNVKTFTVHLASHLEQMDQGIQDRLASITELPAVQAYPKHLRIIESDHDN
jgi:hypothetical protein